MPKKKGKNITQEHVSKFEEEDISLWKSVHEILGHSTNVLSPVLELVAEITPFDYPHSWNSKVAILKENHQQQEALEAAILYEKELPPSAHSKYAIPILAEILGDYYDESNDYKKASYWWTIARDKTTNEVRRIEYQQNLDKAYDRVIQQVFGDELAAGSSSSKKGKGKLKSKAEKSKVSPDLVIGAKRGGEPETTSSKSK